MASVSYAYTVGQEVFHVGANTGVRDAIVSSIHINITTAGTALTYTIAFKNVINGTAIVEENTIHIDVDSALAAYRPLVIIP